MTTNTPTTIITRTCCVQCGARSTDPLYKEYGKRSHSGNIRLTRCNVCDARLDKYLEYDSVLITIDLILHKIEVYRHLLFNSPVFLPDAHSLLSNVSIVFVVMVCFDAYLKWHTGHGSSTAASYAKPGLWQVCPTEDTSAGVGGGTGRGLVSGIVGGTTGTAAEESTPIPSRILSPYAIDVELPSTAGLISDFASDSAVLYLSPALGGGCFNTSAEDAIVERFVDGIRDTNFWVQLISLFSLALAENILYIGAIVLAIRLWESICPLNTTTSNSVNVNNNPRITSVNGTGTNGSPSSSSSSVTASTGVGMSSSFVRSTSSISSSTSTHTTSTIAAVQTQPQPQPTTINTDRTQASGRKKNASNNLKTSFSTSTSTAAAATSVTSAKALSSPEEKKRSHRMRRTRSESMDSGGASVSTTMIVCAIILSSWGKLLLLLLMIWEYSDDMIHVVNFVVVASNFTAVHSLLSIGRWPPRIVSLLLVLFPFGVRTLFQMALSHTFGIAVVYSTEWTPW